MSDRRPSGAPRRSGGSAPRTTSRTVPVQATSVRYLPRVGDPRLRQRIVTLGAIALLLVFAVRLVWIQGVNASELSAQALENRLATAELSTTRADIVDRNGIVMATSVERYHVFVNQQTLAGWKRVDNDQVLAEGPLGAAKILAPILGVSESELAVDLVGDKPFQYVAKYVTPETWDLIRAERISGIDREEVSDRLYPNGDIGGNIIGFVGGREDRQGVEWGLAGIEKSYEDELLGVPGSMTYERGVGGTVIPTGVLDEEPAVPGSDVVLTIDRDLQYYVQEQAAAGLKTTGSSRAIVTVQDVRTGEFLALVDTGSVDPNDPGATDGANRGARSVEAVFEPGSTGKAITIAAAIEEGIVTPTTRFEVPYMYTTENNQTFKDSHDHPVEKLTTAGILVSSSNTGTIKIGEQMSEETRHKYLEAFGFGTKTGVGMPSESAGILRDWEDWDGRTEYAVLYGQGVAVTALQTSQVYQTIANGGVRVQPSIVKGYESADGVFTPRETEDPVRVISEDTAADVMLMLEDVTESGTGRLARIDGYRVAGKTGTAQAADETGQLNDIVASFVGVAPADDPRVVVSVIMFDPKTSIWGGEVAAPVFKDVTTFALQALRVPPSSAREELYPTTWE